MSEIEGLILKLKIAAEKYFIADLELEVKCAAGKPMDPIACTIYALKNKYVDSLPAESFPAAHYLSEVVRIHGELVTKHKMNSDKVRAIWFPILNRRQIESK